MTTGVLGLSLAIVPLAGQSFAQATGDPATTGTTPGTGAGAGSTAGTGAGTGTAANTGAGAGTTETHDDGFDLGWLGLLGLAGLLGLLPKKTHTVTTHRTGDSAGR
jgi:hypothetical protein